MEVRIGELVSTVHAVDGDAPLSPRTMEAIVRAVLRAVDEREAHERRVRAERQVTGGVRAEQIDEDR